MSQFKRWLRMERGSKVHWCKSNKRFLREIKVLIVRWSTALKMRTLKKLCICIGPSEAIIIVTCENKENALVWSWYTTHSLGFYHAPTQGRSEDDIDFSQNHLVHSLSETKYCKDKCFSFPYRSTVCPALRKDRIFPATTVVNELRDRTISDTWNMNAIIARSCAPYVENPWQQLYLRLVGWRPSGSYYSIESLWTGRGDAVA